MNALKERLRPVPHPICRLSKAEADLLQNINLGLPPQKWEQYHTLLTKRRAETLTPEEQATLEEDESLALIMATNAGSH